MTNSKLDVLIVGAGPVGTALAIDLTRRGLAARIIDKAPHSFEGSRAKGIQPRTLEVLFDLGALDDVVAGGSRYPLMGIHVGPLTVPWRMMGSPHARDSGVPYPHTWLIPQYRTDRALHDRLNALGVGVEYLSELTDLSQTSDAVTATISTSAGTEIITARYLVGADGAGSTVRKQVGIGFVGSTDEEDRMLIVDATVDGSLRRDRWHVWPGIGGRFIGACPLPHSEQFQWMIRLARDETPPDSEQEITECIHACTRNKRLSIRDITWKSVFRPNIRLAENYRKGRVFLAGDAAHAHTPAGAQGLNTGVQDSYNLGWKIHHVIAGASEDLLDTYEAERQPIAAGVLGLSTKKYAGIAKLDPSSVKRGRDEQQLALSYHGGPLAPTNTARTSTLQVGDRAPDAQLWNKDRTSTSLFELYRGPHFTAVAYGPTAVAALDQLQSPVDGAAVQKVAVAAAPQTKAEYSDMRGVLRRNYGLNGDTLLLVRPDGYIASISTADMLATTDTAMGRVSPQRKNDTTGRRF